MGQTSTGHASTSSTKPNTHDLKLLFCIWWDQLGIVYYELLNRTKPSRYRLQLMRLSREMKEKRPLYAQDTTK